MPRKSPRTVATPRRGRPQRACGCATYNACVFPFHGTATRVAQVLAPVRAGLHPRHRRAVRGVDAAAGPRAAPCRAGRAARGQRRAGHAHRRRGAGRELRRRRPDRDAGGRQHLHEQGSRRAEPARRRRAVPPLFPRPRQAHGAAAGAQPGLGRHRRARRLCADQLPCRRRRRRHHAGARRRPRDQGHGAWRRPRIRPRRAEGGYRRLAGDHAGRSRIRARRRRGAGDRQSVRLRQHGDRGHRVGARAQSPRHQPLRGLHPDGRADQPRQFRAARWSIPPGT